MIKRHLRVLYYCLIITLFISINIFFASESIHAQEGKYLVGGTQKLISMNITKQMPIDLLLRTLATQCGVSLVISPEITGPSPEITLQNVTFEEALNSIAKATGLEWKKENNIYYIGKPAPPPPPEPIPQVAETVKLKYVKADAAVNLIKDIVEKAQGSVKVVNKELNTIVITAPAQTMATVKDMLQRADVPEAQHFTESFPLKYASVENISKLIQDIVEREAGTVQIVKELNIIVVQATKATLSKVTEILKKADVPAAKAAEGRFTTEKIDVKNISADVAAEVIEDFVESQKGSVQVVDELNVIIVTAPMRIMETVKQMVADVDKPGAPTAAKPPVPTPIELVGPPQVMIEAKFIELNEDASRSFNIDWKITRITRTVDYPPYRLEGGTIGPGPAGVPPSLTYNPTPGKKVSPTIAGGALSFGLLRYTPATYLENTLDTYVSQGKGKVLSAPKIAAMDKQEAVMQYSETYHYFTYTTTTSGGVTTITPTDNEIEVPIRLTIRPEIDVNTRTITVDLHPEVTSIIGWQKSAGTYPIEVPQLATRDATTRLRVKDGETIIIGGLIRRSETETVTKTPILGDLPIFGSLFRSKSKTSKVSDLYIFLTCHILPS